MNWKCSKCGSRELEIVITEATITRKVLGVESGEVLYGEPEVMEGDDLWFQCAHCGALAPELLDDEDIINLYGETDDNNEAENPGGD